MGGEMTDKERLDSLEHVVDRLIRLLRFVDNDVKYKAELDKIRERLWEER
jgi:hypothetical protein